MTDFQNVNRVHIGGILKEIARLFPNTEHSLPLKSVAQSTNAQTVADLYGIRTHFLLWCGSMRD